MTGEMSWIDQNGFDSNGEEWPIHAAVAKALNGVIKSFDKYQGPYIVFGEDLRAGNSPYSSPIQGLGTKRLWLISDDNGFFVRWHREDNNTLSEEFTINEIELAISHAKELLND